MYNIMYIYIYTYTYTRIDTYLLGYFVVLISEKMAGQQAIATPHLESSSWTRGWKSDFTGNMALASWYLAVTHGWKL